jgi:hypothetical protein
MSRPRPSEQFVKGNAIRSKCQDSKACVGVKKQTTDRSMTYVMGHPCHDLNNRPKYFWFCLSVEFQILSLLQNTNTSFVNLLPCNRCTYLSGYYFDIALFNENIKIMRLSGLKMHLHYSNFTFLSHS